MKKRFPLLFVKNGMVFLEGKPRLFISADYPYYRDDARNWRERLQALKTLGIGVITTYLPWRHHQPVPTATPDFCGETAPNRNVLGFLELCRALELLVIAKPGPFVHAELNYGGLPDWVCPWHDSAIEPLRNAEGQPQTWSGGRLTSQGIPEPWPLPAPFSPVFLHLAQDWLRTVGEAVIRPYAAPEGPIIAVQLGNEGIYSNGQHAPWAYDFSASALERFRQFLRARYGSLEACNRAHATYWQTWEEMSFPHPVQQASSTWRQDWSEFQVVFFGDLLRAWQQALGVDLPILLNQNPPLEAPYGLDAWLTRVEPERWPGFHYGFTNWVGDVSANPSAFHRYVLTAKRFPGPNMEENWGFSQLYDPAYRDAATSFYQTLVALNSGATGFNVYTGVGAAHADNNLELIHSPAYPDAAPITPDGLLTPKAETVRWLTEFFHRHGEEFLSCRPLQSVAWGLYLPHARLAVWSALEEAPAPQHGKHLYIFQETMRRLQLDYALVNLETATLDDLQPYRFLFLAGGERMSAQVQDKLAAYTRAGGQLVWLEQIPRLDEQGRSYEVLWQMRSAFLLMPPEDWDLLLADLPRPVLQAGQADVWVRSHPRRDVHFVTLLIPANGENDLEVSLPLGTRWHRVQLSAARAGGALLRVENGQVTDFIIKGVNAYLNDFVAPRCQFDEQTFGLDHAGDLFHLANARYALLVETILEPKH